MDNSSQEEDKQADAKTSAAPASFSYQRAPAAPTSAPAAYPGSTGYAGSYASGSAAETRSVSSSSDRRLTIGSGITMSGEIESCDYLLVEGTVEAALKGANVLDIADSGTFYGTVEIDEATIAGRFEGDITVHGRLTISSTGTVTGTIAYKELEIEAGAVIDGKLTPLSAASAAKKEAPSKAKETSAPAAPAKAKKTEVKETEAANNDGGLFSKAAAAE
ncbi:MAG: polymer-forming cytoskeletal protein [Micavibrio sp.]|nr:polymer-forming cytoskeletal protein [Micavibrio sp.]